MGVWIGRNGERHGPYPEADVRQWLRDGQVSPDDLGWREGLADWQPLSTLFPDERPANGGTAAVPPLPSQPAELVMDYAGFWQRFGAWVIDLLILMVPSMIVFHLLGGTAAYMKLLEQMQAGADMTHAVGEYTTAARPGSIAAVLVGFVYYVLFECSKWQATPGKLALRLRVTDLDGRRLTPGRAAARNAVRLVGIVTGLIPFVCYLAVAWTARKQGLHDLLASTLVLNGRASDLDATTRPARDKPADHGSFSA
jgi:uncharacterized RDD family membrane protein YckC